MGLMTGVCLQEDKRLRGEEDGDEDISGESDSDGGWGATASMTEARKAGKGVNKSTHRSGRSKGGSRSRNARGGRAGEETANGKGEANVAAPVRPHDPHKAPFSATRSIYYFMLFGLINDTCTGAGAHTSSPLSEYARIS
jgi:hypothetical protein